MRIGVDASKIADSQRTGLGNTILPIILGLRSIDKTNQYILYTGKPLPKEILSENFEERLIPSFAFWHSIKLPATLRKDNLDLFFEMTYRLPKGLPKRAITILHDFAFKYFPECYSSLEKYLQEKTVHTAIKKAEKIIVSSEANKQDLIKFYNCPVQEIVVIPFGLGNPNSKIEEASEIAKLKVPFFLTVGRLEKRKNTLNIIKAFNIFKEQTNSSAKLVLAGKPGYGAKEIENEIIASKYKSDIIKLGFVSEGNLNFLYAKALALIYPSLYEGFGFPALEAMQKSTPVLTSNVPTLREIVGNGALLVDPTKIEEISQGMYKLYKDMNIRSTLITKGKENIKRFSWEQTSKKILEIINGK